MKKITEENPIVQLPYEEIVQLRNVISNKEIDSSFIDKTSKIDEKPATGFSTVVDDGVTPANPTGLTATAGIQFIFLQWTYNTETDMSHYEIWRNTTNNNATATKIAQTKANVFTDESVIAGTAYFYWIKAVDHLGNVSGFNATAGSSATPRNVMSGDIVDLSITETKLANAAVITSKLANLAVDNTKLANLAVDAAKLADSAVTATKIANLAVGSAAIANLAVGTSKIANAAITNAKIANLAVTDAKISNLSANKINAGTLTGRTVQTALTGRRIRISSATGLTDRVSFLDGNTEEGYLRLEQAGLDWEMSIGGLNGDMFTVGTSVAAGAPIYVSMPFFGGAGTGATGQADISGGSGNNARAIGLSWSGGGAPIFRLDLSGRGITRIGNSLIPQWNDDLGTSANRWRHFFLSGNIYISADGKMFIDMIDFRARGVPSSPGKGTLYYDIAVNKLKFWTGIKWETISST